MQFYFSFLVVNIKICAMKLPTVDKFVFYFSLEIGAMILAGLSIAMSVSIIAVATSFLVRYATFFSTLNETDQDFFRQFLISKRNTIKNNNNLITCFYSFYCCLHNLHSLFWHCFCCCDYANYRNTKCKNLWYKIFI